MTKEYFLEKARSIHGYKYEYIDLKEKMTYKDRINIKINGCIYQQSVRGHIEGKEPDKALNKITKDEFIKKSKELWGEDFFDYSLLDLKNMNNKVKLIERSNGRIHEVYPTNHFKKSNINKIENNFFIDECNHIHNFRYDYSETIYSRSDRKIKIICPTHGNFETLAFNHYRNLLGCNKCKNYEIIKNIKKFLSKLNINYYTNEKFDGLRRKYDLSFNFYIPSFRVAIEVFSDDELTKNYENYMNHLFKENYCEENLIDLIKIRYDSVINLDELLYTNLDFYINKFNKNNIKF